LSSNRLRHDAEYYERHFDPLNTDRKARRKRKPKVVHHAKKAESDILHEVADVAGVEGGFKTTYSPSKYEATWLLSSLEGFYEEDYITDIRHLVKGGKEASVYCCTASPSLGIDVVAAKVYRPRMFRQLRNDKMYQEGRRVLTGDGRPAKETDHRLMRAVGKKTAFGAEVSHHSWLLHEYTTLQTLFVAGAAVPKPYAVAENAILMSHIGDARSSAPALSEITLEPDEIEPLFRETLRNIDLMLQHGMIHGDLSAYNILYWEGEITLIDFPQVTSAEVNSNAQFILERDVLRVCEYFQKYGLRCQPHRIADALWQKYSTPKLPIDIDLPLNDAD
jgi:RIO kinase 1